MKSGVVNIHAMVQLMIGKICVIKWLLMPGESWDKAHLNRFSMDGLDYIASICSLISEENIKNLATENGTQWTNIEACRNNLYILKKGPQTPCESFGMMV